MKGLFPLILGGIVVYLFIQSRKAAAPAPSGGFMSNPWAAASQVIERAPAPVQDVWRSTVPGGPGGVPALASAPMAPKSYQSGGVMYGTQLNGGRIA